jgi:protein-S-isoprenylcysteine O-methyltransferase Ste14
MTPTFNQLLVLAMAWLVFFVIHSTLAAATTKAWVTHRHPALAPGYRLFFNGMAIVTVAIPLVMMRQFRGDLLWSWTGPGFWIANSIALLGIGGFVWSLRYYSGAEFAGFAQLQRHQTNADSHEALYISPLHRYVRHPWYLFGLMIIWTRDMDPAFLLSAIMMTGYFFVGARLEEHKLIRYYGDVYHEYCQCVPGILPRPGKILTRERAAQLESRSRG